MTKTDKQIDALRVELERGKAIQALFDLNKKVDVLSEALIGNGKPEEGFIYRASARFERIEGDKRWAEKFLNAFIAAGIALGFSFLAPHQK